MAAPDRPRSRSERRLALNVDIDELRVRLGGWRNDTEAKPVARSLGFGLAKSHLESGYDVVLPQLLVKFEVIDQVASIAASAGAEFVEVVLVAPLQEILDRLDESIGTPHPRGHLSRDELREHIDYALQQLRRRVDVQPNALLVDIGDLGVTRHARRCRPRSAGSHTERSLANAGSTRPGAPNGACAANVSR